MNNINKLKERLERLENEKEELEKKLEMTTNNRRQDYIARIIEQVPQLSEEHLMKTEQPSNQRFKKEGLKVLAEHLEQEAEVVA